MKPTEIAAEFDRMWEMWARGIPYSDDVLEGTDHLDEVHPWVASQCSPWLDRILEDNPVAKACGRRSIPILHSILEKESNEGGNIVSHFLGRWAPTYYGMMTVVFRVNK